VRSRSRVVQIQSEQVLAQAVAAYVTVNPDQRILETKLQLWTYNVHSQQIPVSDAQELGAGCGLASLTAGGPSFDLNRLKPCSFRSFLHPLLVLQCLRSGSSPGGGCFGHRLSAAASPTTSSGGPPAGVPLLCVFLMIMIDRSCLIGYDRTIMQMI